MATLETQYKHYLLNNPESKFTFKEWKEWWGKQIEKGVRFLKEFQPQQKKK